MMACGRRGVGRVGRWRRGTNLLVAMIGLACALAPIRAAANDLARYVNPFIGTAVQTGATFGAGNVFPGAVAPYGMVQWSPDTTRDPGGYTYTATTIHDFSLTHFSGRGCSCYQDIGFMPVLGPLKVSPGKDWSSYSSRFSHKTESASPGFYGVRLEKDGIEVKLTATPRTGFGVFTFPRNSNATILISAGVSANGNHDTGTGVTVLGSDEVTGSASSTVGCGGEHYTVYFAARFDRPFVGMGTWNGDDLTPDARSASGGKSGAYFTFDTSRNRSVQVRVGLSYVSVENAKANLLSENNNWSFESVRRQTRGAWNQILSRIEVDGGSRANTEAFYTALYHCFIHPNIFSDTNGEYVGFDQQVHTIHPGHAHYENIPGWDEYRSLCQLRAFLAPGTTSDILQSLVDDAEQGGGGLPRWEQTNRNSNGMVGDSPDAFIASAYALGATDFNANAALEAMDKGASAASIKSDGHTVREASKQYDTLGYVPGAASITMEYATDDFALSRFAAALGDSKRANQYLRRAQNWKNLYNPQSGYIQPRNTDGSWTANFKPTDGKGFVEGDSAQYTWMEPFNLKGLFDAMGGSAAATQRLTEHFTQVNGGANSPYGFLGNEPEECVPWEFDFGGVPWKTQEVVRRIQTQLFLNTPGGLPGNDDAGTLSSWYVFSALGFYPELPGVAGFVVGSPLFPNIIIHLENGRTVRVMGRNAADNHPYVQSLSVNGKSTTSLWIPFSSLKDGGELRFTLGTVANSSWGSAPADAPPSFGEPAM